MTMVNDEQLFSTREKAENFCKEQSWLYKQGRNDITVDEFEADGTGYFMCSDYYSMSASIFGREAR